MFSWFEQVAPIKTKFKLLIASNGFFASAGLFTTYLANGRSSLIFIPAAATGMSILVSLIASQKICTPYVNTVVRMEALARGDTQSPILYTNHQDCVGRMTKALATFRTNAVELEKNREGNEKQIVASLGVGLKKLAEGDLRYQIHQPFPGSYDLLRQDFNSAMNFMSATINSVHQASESVSTGAAEIRAASNDLALRNEQQAASLEETAASMKQITALVRDTASKSENAQNAIAEAHREASSGQEIVHRAVDAMATIESSAQEINSIINIIDGIAFQTNLLALNAGVEAARAGDAGRGFAVVASEVRALAQRSADAAKDIKNLIGKSSEQVGNGVIQVRDTGALLGKIVVRVGAINGMVSEMASAAQIQATNLEQVNVSVLEMDRMTQQNAAMVEQSTASAGSLANEARALTSLVAQFRTDAASVSYMPSQAGTVSLAA